MGVCDVPAIAVVCDVAGEAAGRLVAAPFAWLSAAMGETAVWLFDGVWRLLDTTTVVELTSPGYIAVYNLVFGIAVMLMLLFFFLQLGKGLVQRDPAALARAALGLGRSIIGGFVTLGLCVSVLEIIDQLSVGLVHAAGLSMAQVGDRLAASVVGLTTLSLSTPTVGIVMTIMLSALASTAVVLVWFTMLLRQSMLLVAIVLAPVAMSGFSWDAARGWFGRWGSFVLALAVSKLVIVVVLLVGTTQVSAPIDMDLGSIADPLTGVVLMFIAAFAPYLSYKLISFAGADGHLSTAAEQDVRGALAGPTRMPAYRLHQARAILGGSGAPQPPASTGPRTSLGAPSTSGAAAGPTVASHPAAAAAATVGAAGKAARSMADTAEAHTPAPPAGGAPPRSPGGSA